MLEKYKEHIIKYVITFILGGIITIVMMTYANSSSITLLNNKASDLEIRITDLEGNEKVLNTTVSEAKAIFKSIKNVKEIEEMVIRNDEKLKITIEAVNRNTEDIKKLRNK